MAGTAGSLRGRASGTQQHNLRARNDAARPQLRCATARILGGALQRVTCRTRGIIGLVLAAALGLAALVPVALGPVALGPVAPAWAQGGLDGERMQALERIRDAPEDASGFEALAGWLFRSGDLRRAVAAAAEAARLEPDVAARQRLLGYLQAANGNGPAAETAFRHAAELDPAGHAWLADFHLAQAWSEYQDALRSGRSDALLAERVRGLGALAETSPDLKALMRTAPASDAAALERVPPIFLGPEVDNALVVEKRTQTLRLYGRTGSDLALLQTYPCTTGQEPGPKRHRGDRRTPDGVYVVSDLMHGDALPERYGALALPLSYPNAWDRRLRRGGYGIWLHGSDRLGSPFTRRDTSGCVILRNEDLVELSRILVPGMTPILIAEEIPYRPVAEWKATVEALLRDAAVEHVLAVVAGPEYAVITHRDETTVTLDFASQTDHWHVVTSEQLSLMPRAEWQAKVDATVPSKPVALLRVQVLDAEEPPRIIIETTGPAGVRGYRPELTDELYLDLPGVRAAPIPSVVLGGGAWVKAVRITAAQIEPPLTRLVVSLHAPMEYRVANEGNRIVVSLAAGTR